MSNVQEKVAFTFDEISPKRISYILATKNRSSFLKGALQRLKVLVGPQDELLVIDGGSTDGTLEVVKGFGGLVNVFVSEPDDNAYEASNKGIMLARGKFVYVIADDDVVHSEGMRKAIGTLEANPQIDLLLCGGTKQFGSGSVFYFYVPSDANYGHRPEDTIIYGATGSGLVARRRIFSKIGLQGGLAADGELVTKCIANGGIVKFCRINLFHQTIYPHSVTRSKKYLHRKHQFEYIKKYCSRVFYWKYRIARTFRDSFLNKMLTKFERVIRIKITGNSGKKHSRDTECVWDGGFS